MAGLRFPTFLFLCVGEIATDRQLVYCSSRVFLSGMYALDVYQAPVHVRSVEKQADFVCTPLICLFLTDSST